MLFSQIPRLRFIAPTPLEPLTRLGAAWGHPSLYLKRDDLLSIGLGGNKLRSIEFWFGEAQARGADLLLVAGGLASNQCRLVAAAACKLNWECHILHNAEQPQELQGNQLLTELMGVTRVYLGPLDEEERARRVEEYAQEQRRRGRKPYIVGDPVLGALGYVNAALELHAQAEAQNLDIRHLVIAGSMGPTEAGLLWGSALLGKAFRVYTPSVEYDTSTLRGLIADICRGISAKLGFQPALDPLDILEAWDDCLGSGYDRPTPESLQAVRDLASLEGLFIETTYNAKVFAALKDLLAQGRIAKKEGICIVHTGGIPALFGQSDRFTR